MHCYDALWCCFFHISIIKEPTDIKTNGMQWLHQCFFTTNRLFSNLYFHCSPVKTSVFWVYLLKKNNNSLCHNCTTHLSQCPTHLSHKPPVPISHYVLAYTLCMCGHNEHQCDSWCCCSPTQHTTLHQYFHSSPTNIRTSVHYTNFCMAYCNKMQ